MPGCYLELELAMTIKILTNSTWKYIFLSSTNIDETLNMIKKLNPRKLCGPDNIGVNVIKLCPVIYYAENLYIYITKQ